MLKKGLVQVYTGNSDLFNFAPIGLCVRAAGQGLSSLITCFLPIYLMRSAAIASSFLKPYLFFDNPHVDPSSFNKKVFKEKSLASFKKAENAAISAEFDIIVLNDVHALLEEKVVSTENLVSLIQDKSSKVELILAGRDLPFEIVENADLVTEMVLSLSDQNDTKPVVEVITGDGKGKSTYCFGKSVLMACLGSKALILQFIKSPHPYGEVKAIRKIPNIQIRTMGEGFIFSDDKEEKKKHAEAAQKAWQSCIEEITSQKYEIIVLDEINIATHFDLIKWEQIRQILTPEQRGMHFLLSGRNAHPGAVKAATKFIEMKEIKHPYKKGIKARKGIEY
jgi:cob(I)alamin adenosyltransferase